MVCVVVLLVAGVSVVLSSVVLVLVVGRSLAQPAKVRSNIPKARGINFFIEKGHMRASMVRDAHIPQNSYWGVVVVVVFLVLSTVVPDESSVEVVC